MYCFVPASILEAYWYGYVVSLPALLLRFSDSGLAHLVAEIKSLMSTSRHAVVRKITRSQNEASDALARFGRTSDSKGVWLESGPDPTGL